MTPGTFAKHLWALPCSLIGLLPAALLLLAGGRAHLGHGTLLAAWRRDDLACSARVRRMRFRAITFGHVILAVTERDLRLSLAHELVHVRQYERWGLLFFAAYGASSLWQWLRGRDPYWDNRFEVEARARSSDGICHGA